MVWVSIKEGLINTALNGLSLVVMVRAHLVSDAGRHVADVHMVAHNNDQIIF